MEGVLDTLNERAFKELSTFVRSSTAQIQAAGYDELEFIKVASAADIQDLAAATKMLKPHATAFLAAWKRLSPLGEGAPVPMETIAVTIRALRDQNEHHYTPRRLPARLRPKRRRS